MRSWLNLRHAESERAAVFTQGLERIGYEVLRGAPLQPRPGDILVTWNRMAAGETSACAFEAWGCPVIVAENASWGNEFAGRQWLTLARNRHNTAGRFPVGGPERWDALGVELEPWRPPGGETVILAQRGLGSPPTAMPRDWPNTVSGRLRAHPGPRAPLIPLRDDLASASKVITWGSSAAVLALTWGIPVESHMPDWIGAQDNSDEGRVSMLRALAWAQWRPDEIASGEPFARLLE